MTELEIASRLKTGKQFNVISNRQRIQVLHCSKYLGVKIATKKSERGGFDVLFVKTI